MKILLVEDGASELERLHSFLAEERFTLDTATDGVTAFEKARQRKYDLIILDLMLPKRSGFEVITQLRILNNNVPILILSSRAGVEDRVLGLNLGADDYLVKPYEANELVARVKALLRREGGVRRNMLKCQDVIMNLDNMTVQRGGQRVHLSKKEFGILHEIMRHKNSVVSRDAIIDSVWGERDLPVLSNTIDVHIRTLRHKIEKAFPAKPKLLKTVRGYGYMISEIKA